MINSIVESNIPYVLSETTREAYSKLKALIMKIFSLLKMRKKTEQDLKHKFDESYIDFAKKLKEEGHEEYHEYMTICAMYSQLIERPKLLISHEDFFKELFDSFDELLNMKISNCSNYEDKYNEYIIFLGKKQEYFYRNLAIPSDKYNKNTINQIIHNLSGGLND